MGEIPSDSESLSWLPPELTASLVSPKIKIARVRSVFLSCSLGMLWLRWLRLKSSDVKKEAEDTEKERWHENTFYFWLFFFLNFIELYSWHKMLRWWEMPFSRKTPTRHPVLGGAPYEMVGWHHRCNGLELEQIPGDGKGQGSLACCSPRGRKKLDMTWQLSNNNNNLVWQLVDRQWLHS